MKFTPQYSLNENELFIELPPFYIIEPTNYCNYKCVMCPNRFYKSNDLGVMNLSLFRKIIDEIAKYAIYIQLYWMGEPLLNNDLAYMVEYIKTTTNAKVIISTNGSLLTPEVVKLLCESNLDTIIISLDAIDSQNIYSKIRCGGDIEKVICNTEYLLNNAESIDVILQMLCFKENCSEREKIIKRFEQYNYKLRFSWVDTWAGMFPEIADIADEISPMLHKERWPCADLWYKATIHWNGSLALCCHDWNWQIELGNINEKPLCQLWNSETMRELRYLHTQKCFDQIPLCKDCIEWAIVEEYHEFI